MSYRGLPAELKTILNRPEGFPVLSPSEAAMIRAWLKATPPPARNPVHVAHGIISADWQYEMAVYNRERQRLTLILEYHEQRLAAPIALEHEHAAPDVEPSAPASSARSPDEKPRFQSPNEPGTRHCSLTDALVASGWQDS